MSRGNRVVLNIAQQSDVDIVPQDGWKNLPYKSENLDHKVELTDSETITASRLKTAGIPTKASVEGDIEVEFPGGSNEAHEAHRKGHGNAQECEDNKSP